MAYGTKKVRRERTVSRNKKPEQSGKKKNGQNKDGVGVSWPHEVRTV